MVSGFDEQWRGDKVLVCSIARTRTVQVWAWLTRSRPGVLEEATQQALYIRRETGRPAWVEHYGEPAALPDQPRRFGQGFKER